MPCPRCHADAPATSPFCSVCAGSLRARRERYAPLRDGTRPVLRVRPVFLASAHLHANAPVYLFVALWSTLVFGGLARLLVGQVDSSLLAWAPFAVFGIALAIAVPVVGMSLSKRTYAGTEFVFHPHRLDYARGFLTPKPRSMRLADIIDVRLAPDDEATSPVLGTVLISARASAPDVDRVVRITDVPDAAELVARIRTMIVAPEPELAAIPHAA